MSDSYFLLYYKLYLLHMWEPYYSIDGSKPVIINVIINKLVYTNSVVTGGYLLGPTLSF